MRWLDITWQGNGGHGDPVGTTIRAALEAAAPNVKVTYAPGGFGAEGASVDIAVIGEKPYAEGGGDRAEMRLSSESVTTVARLKYAGVKVVVIVISGRPLVLDDIHPYADAIVAAWLPGTEGAGVADVLFGDYKPTAKLSFSWPRGSSTSYHVGDAGYETLHPVGYGLSYS